jgi:hypothetical protein
MWSEVKQSLRSLAARTLDALAVTTALQMITAGDCEGFSATAATRGFHIFNHCAVSRLFTTDRSDLR